MFNRRTLIAVVGVLAASLTLSACSAGTTDTGNDSPGSSESAATFNDQDVMFAQSMLVHHTQAIDMAQTILDKEDIDPRVMELAQDIKDAQAPEIDQLNGFLDTWGAPSEMEEMNGMEMGGMMSESDMADLESATGVEASRLFLEQMTDHHMGAVEMAQIEVDNGQDTDATALAQKIIDDQSAELDVMEKILATL